MNVFSFIIVVLLVWFCVSQIIGFARDLRKKKHKKNNEIKNGGETEENTDNEQN